MKNELFNYLPRPTSVHRLRPNDIEVIGAMGDSSTAANGARARSLFMLLIEYRGVAWSIGGENPDITQLITLPSN
jgi:phospholipase B1